MISIITPTHNAKYLQDAYRSLQSQTVQNWEWVLVPNGEAVIQDEIKLDPRVKIFEFPFKVDNIGALKNYAFSKGTGEYLCEFDHDDLLAPTALEECEVAFNESPNVVFCYSNSVEFRNESWEPFTYSAAYGWQYRDFEYEGHKLLEAVAFKPTPHSLGFIYYAPNHFRAWKRDAYLALGGHDKTMKVIDDHDLMCRTYLHGEMHHIDKPLYLYRVHGANSWLEKNADIQKETKKVYDKYIYKLVETWCDRNNFIKLDVGAERGKSPAGWLTIDIRPGCDYQADLRDRWPFADNTFGAIRAWDFMEHLPDKIHTLNEIYRVLKPGGWLLSGTPSTDGRGAYQDPTHVSFWNENSFWYHTKKQYQHFVPEIKSRFQNWRTETIFPTDWHKQNNISYVVADLVAIKEGWQRPESHVPGLIEIQG